MADLLGAIDAAEAEAPNDNSMNELEEDWGGVEKPAIVSAPQKMSGANNDDLAGLTSALRKVAVGELRKPNGPPGFVMKPATVASSGQFVLKPSMFGAPAPGGIGGPHPGSYSGWHTK